MERFTFNLSKPVRNDSMGGRDYLVVPMVMITEGVHAGSNGPLYYPKDELAQTPFVWNHKPIVVYHPQGTACDPDVITNRGVGMVMNTVWDAKGDIGKLRAEAWLDKERCDVVDKRILETLEKNAIMEVSTGLVTENEATAGEWNGEKYDGIARNYKPDHLALLPDKEGACSVKDGAGLLQLNEANKKLQLNTAHKTARGLLATSLSQGSGKLLENELSHSAVYSALSSAMRQKTNDAWNGWIEDVFDSYFVYWESGDLFKQKYIASDSEVTLVEEPQKVQRVTSYETITNQKGSPMAKKELVDALIANTSNKWVETDRPFLIALNDEQIEKMGSVETPKPTTAVTDPEDDDEEEEATPAVTNKKKKKKDAAVSTYESVDDYIANAPEGMRDVLADGVAHVANERKRLTEIVTGNARNQFTAEQLAAKPIREIRQLAALAQPVAQAPTPNFLGAAGGAPVVANAVTETPLPLPSMSWGK